jgi:hypothetical protein
MRKVKLVQCIGLFLLLVLATTGVWSASGGTIFAQSPDEASVTFPDPNLESTIRNAIDKPEGAIYISDVETLTSLSATKRGISNLIGMEYCIGLEELDLAGNSISDISPLTGLSKLKKLELSHNRISDISPMLSGKWLSHDYRLFLGKNPLSTTSLHLGIPLLHKNGVVICTEELDPDWLSITGAFIPLTGAGLATICYLAVCRRRKWLRPASLAMGVMGAVLLALCLLPAAASYRASSVPEGTAVFLATVACLIILTSAAVGWRRELSGGVWLIVGSLIAGVAYPVWLFHTASIITFFPLVSGFLYILSWRDRPGRTIVESTGKLPFPLQSRKRLRHAPLIVGIVIAGPIGLLAVLYFWANMSFEHPIRSWDLYFLWIAVEGWCLALACSILAARKYW